MNRTFQYRLYPTKKQQSMLNTWLALCCETYNAALQERRDAYRMAGISLGYSQQCAELPNCKQVRPDLAEVNSQVMQDVLKRVDRAFDGFFRRVKDGQQPGYPRFRSRSRYQSLTFHGMRNELRFWLKKLRRLAQRSRFSLDQKYLYLMRERKRARKVLSSQITSELKLVAHPVG